MSEQEHRFDVAQLVSVALFSPKPDETVRFFHDFLGMEISHQEGQAVYLRAYEDFYQYTMKVVEAPQAGMEAVTWRAASPQALERRVQALEAAGLGLGWVEDDYAHGPAYKFTSPDGHVQKLLWELDYYQAPPEMKSKLKNRPQKRPLRGVPVRRIDHVNLMVSDVPQNTDFFANVLNFKIREQKIGDGGALVGSWLSVSPLVHELAVMKDSSGAKGRFHHVAYWYGAPQHLLDIADIFSDYDIIIEGGPGKHGTTQAYYMYVFEPGGNRVELFGDTGYLIFDPDWQTVIWDVANEVDLEKSSIWFGGHLPKTFYTYGTPPVESLEVLMGSA
ncbi:MAG: catechol 2,3-dioxygenase [Chloroflexi bacterium]|nr:MAG: catechol 2,3-dioxygenase [Chloroflexota bacterium]